MPVEYTEEKDALHLWCPFARVLFSRSHYETGSSAAGFNRSVEKYKSEPILGTQALCIASKCAKWDSEKKFSEYTGRGRCGA